MTDRKILKHMKGDYHILKRESRPDYKEAEKPLKKVHKKVHKRMRKLGIKTKHRPLKIRVGGR